jgi:predicted transcriptional regulator of viral defense system
MSLTIAEAMPRALKETGRAVTTEYELFLLLRQLYLTKEYEGQRFRIRKAKPAVADGYRLINELTGDEWAREAHALEVDRDFKSGVYRVLAVPDQPADEVCCEVDPFCYVSHLSAMQYHGLTNRTPVELTLTTPARGLWNKLRDARMADDYGDDLGEPDVVVPFKQYSFEDKVRNRVVQRHESRHPGEWRQIRDKAVRVATIGQTFLDMLDKSNWCGGIHHVLEVWENEARTYLEEIVAAVNRAPTAMIKVRAGYLLEEKLEIRDKRIAEWARYAQRGGSRRLDPEAPYQPVFSEKWMISLNV